MDELDDVDDDELDEVDIELLLTEIIIDDEDELEVYVVEVRFDVDTNELLLSVIL